MNGQGAPVIDLRDVTVRYNDRTALDDVTMTIAPGSYVGLVGPNGSGKSTLLRALLGLVPVESGDIRIDGSTNGTGRRGLAYMPQRQRVDWDFPMTVWDAVMMGRLRNIGWLRRARRADREAAQWSLERVDMLDRRNSLIGELSGGQQQRAFLARALAQEGRVLLLDEPLTGVDTATQDIVLGVLDELHREGRTILIATHDLNTAACTCDSLCLLNGRLVAYGPVAATFTPELLRETYGGHVHFQEATDAGAAHAVIAEDIHHH